MGGLRRVPYRGFLRGGDYKKSILGLRRAETRPKLKESLPENESVRMKRRSAREVFRQCSWGVISRIRELESARDALLGK